ncbi:hypothetical protein SERLA73DRAFT_137686 [Serpula lacrymans var. lacrymans S7.3]|uniref:Uncharacterized protein n=1 Tax=Serpula lacrymans var. lacrymans (strain S7.3) TaxID=936435 RepID=F8PX96_SERL3|nr:hypothetical protein SERLA73DRAFT_137686 [Serpula lacrymans var. lacrymans S7.3]
MHEKRRARHDCKFASVFTGYAWSEENRAGYPNTSDQVKGTLARGQSICKRFLGQNPPKSSRLLRVQSINQTTLTVCLKVHRAQ